MVPQIQPLYFRLLQLFDQVQFLRDRFLNTEFVYIWGTFYTAGLLALAFGMLAYWLYCSSVLMMAAEVELTETDISLMRWNRRCWARVQHLFLVP